MKVYLRICPVFILILLFFVSCGFDIQQESEVPVEEWTVTKVELEKFQDHQYLTAYLSGYSGTIGDYYYYKDFHHTTQLDESLMMVIPGVIFYNLLGFSGGTLGLGIDSGPEMPEGTVVTFNNDCFYQIDRGDGLFSGTEVRRKIRIVTKTMGVTIVDY